MIDPRFREIRDLCVQRYLRAEPGLLASWALSLRRGGLPNALIAPFNVHGIGIARKQTNGQKTDRLCVQVTVLRKLPPGEVSNHDGTLMEREIAGIPIDVVESGPLLIEPQNETAGDAQAVSRVDPLRPGCSISHGNALFGTLGALCRSTRPGERGDVYMLSCRHVLAGFATRQLRKEIFQPGSTQVGQPSDRVADGYDRLVETASPNATPEPYSADAAIAKLDPTVRFDTDYLGIGPSSGMIDLLGPDADEEALLQDKAFIKFGRTTGLTVGTLDTVRQNRFALLAGRTRVFNDQFVIKRVPGSVVPMSDPGDSGAMMFHQDSRKAAGIVIGAPVGPNNDEETIVSPLEPILRELEIELL